MSDLLQLDSVWHYPAIPFDAPTGNLVQIGVTATEQARVQARSAPVQGELVLVLDRSGSMFVADSELRPIDAMFNAVERLIKALDVRDRLAIIAFDDEATKVCDLTAGESRGDIERLLAEFRRGCTNGGSTSMAPALGMAAELIRAGARNKRGARIVVFTDGKADDADQVLKLVATLEGQSIGALGFGRFDFAFMSKVCAPGNGVCVDIGKDMSRLDALFRNELTTAQKTLATNLRLHLRVDDYLQGQHAFLSHPLVTYLGQVQLDADRGCTLDLGNFDQDLGLRLVLNTVSRRCDPGPRDALVMELLYDVPALGLTDQKATGKAVLRWVASNAEIEREDKRVPEAFARCWDEWGRLQLDNAMSREDWKTAAACIKRLEGSQTPAVREAVAEIKKKLTSSGQISPEDIKNLTEKTRKVADRDPNATRKTESRSGTTS